MSDDIREFIDIAPSATREVCYNCNHCSCWGVATGMCMITGDDHAYEDTCNDYLCCVDGTDRLV